MSAKKDQEETEAKSGAETSTTSGAKKKAKEVVSKETNLKKYQTHSKDTGSIQVQIIGLTENINDLSKHLQVHKKDFDSRRGLLRMVARRRRLLTALQSVNQDLYEKMISDLGLRK